ncbi:Flotillin family [Parasponia andersonii]|uniref:Flotillin-like n=1 Tax=Parasponia andersonii TaxID=3476 RepID=A0A2P5B0F0_PARAD|nr:Flotillin family [Parasponia andersonii]
MINDIKLAKKALIWPFQRCTRLDVSAVNYSFEVQATSSEKLPFILSAVFTIGPKADDENACLLYAKLVSSHDKHSNHVNELVQGIIEGETRVLAASMTMEEVFMGTKEFKKAIFENVRVELSQFCLLIYNANVKQLVDVRGKEYFPYLGQRTQVEAANRAKCNCGKNGLETLYRATKKLCFSEEFWKPRGALATLVFEDWKNSVVIDDYNLQYFENEDVAYLRNIVISPSLLQTVQQSQWQDRELRTTWN